MPDPCLVKLADEQDHMRLIEAANRCARIAEMPISCATIRQMKQTQAVIANFLNMCDAAHLTKGHIHM